MTCLCPTAQARKYSALLQGLRNALRELIGAGRAAAVAIVAREQIGNLLRVLPLHELADGAEVAVAAAHELHVVQLAIHELERDFPRANAFRLPGRAQEAARKQPAMLPGNSIVVSYFSALLFFCLRF